tara:strand:+ start:1747 stop:1890 length:144 start_codon:yes stop_codon:yes gene_type:complete
MLVRMEVPCFQLLQMKSWSAEPRLAVMEDPCYQLHQMKIQIVELQQQ